MSDYLQYQTEYFTRLLGMYGECKVFFKVSMNNEKASRLEEVVVQEDIRWTVRCLHGTELTVNI